MKYNILYTNKFERDVKRQKRRGKNLQKLAKIVELLSEGEEILSNVVSQLRKCTLKLSFSSCLSYLLELFAEEYNPENVAILGMNDKPFPVTRNIKSLHWSSML